MTVVYAPDFDPPYPWRALYFRMEERGSRSRTDRSVAHLTSDELRWVGRVVAAEMRRRKERRKTA